MKSFVIAAAVAASTVSAHSWVECTNQDTSQLLPWMKGNSTLNPPAIIDPGMPYYQNFCSGYPRNKQNPGNWIDESSNYAWYLLQQKNANGDTHACHPNQRTPTYQPNAPMASAKPGDSIRLFFGGNGHARGYNAPSPTGGDPGTISVYWAGKPETEITDQKEFTQQNLLQKQGFSDDSFSYPADPNIKRPQDGLVDKGNWMNLKLPSDIAAGRHMMVWVWDFAGSPQWSTCFDIMVSGSASSPSSGDSKPAPAAPAAPVKAPDAAPVAPAAPAVPAAPATPANPASGAYAENPAPAAPAPAAPAVPAPVAEPTKGKSCGAKYNKVKRHARDFERRHFENLQRARQ